MPRASDIDADVLIVGAGPVGLMLANLLGALGVTTMVVERHDSTVQEPRAVTLDDESLRTVQAAGLLAPVLGDIVQGYGVQYFSWRGKPFASIQPTRQEFGFPKRNAFRQPLFEQSLREGLARFAHVRLHFGHELLGFEDTADGVVAELETRSGKRTVRTRWMIGCDGARSGVRERCGIRLAGSTYAERWLIVDLAHRTSTLRHTQTFCDPRRPAIRLPGPQATLRYEFMLRPGEDDDFALHEPRFRDWMAQRCAEDRDLPLVRKAVYAFHARVAEHWRRGHVLLAGDAAHLTPPFAGQGLNSGIRDAANLAWKLAAVTRWNAPAALMDSYEAERRPHALALIRMALRIGRFMQPRTIAGAAAMQAALRVACWLPPVRDYILQLRFKPKPRFAGTGAELVPQPTVDLPDRSSCRLDELLGTGFAVIGWDTPRFRACAALLGPPDAPARVVALRRAAEDFVHAEADGDRIAEARDGSGALEAFLDRLHAVALVLRPDRYSWRCVGADELHRMADGSISQRRWPLVNLLETPHETAELHP